MAVKIGKRIAQARKMAGYRSAKSFREVLPDWPENRLSWYEAGYSMPHPSDVEVIAQVTGSSACWIYFGLGPIRSGERDLQAVRHQNLVYLHAQSMQDSNGVSHVLPVLGLTAIGLADFLDNPFNAIDDAMARIIEEAWKRPHQWLDEQHVESDGLCSSFPDELRELMTIYSEFDEKNQHLLLALARTMANQG